MDYYNCRFLLEVWLPFLIKLKDTESYLSFSINEFRCKFPYEQGWWWLKISERPRAVSWVISCDNHFKLNDLTFSNWHLVNSSQVHFMNPLTSLIFLLTRGGKWYSMTRGVIFFSFEIKRFPIKSSPCEVFIKTVLRNWKRKR